MRSLVQLVLKLSGAAFRPLFLQLVEWAGSIPSRRPILYRTLDTLIEALQSLMLPFLPPVLDDLFGYLEGQGSGKEEAWIWAVRLIHHALLYSEDDEMWSGGKLERLAPALVKQISQIPLEEEGMGDEDEDGMEGGTEQELELKRAIVQLAVTSGNDVVWKALNGQLLLQTRSEEASIRLAAVRTLTACWTRLGEEWLILLPETIPFLAELMEDEDERVESAVQVLTSEMERFLGEPMQKYFE
ncbi:MAG: hypothetical protein DHS80DRAFT_18155 [Piptocephalis tieghemiana]|nr:MAG: hypothetical protein DHS80DRAFT_18155 [Piptocephalis tieghemiana]